MRIQDSKLLLFTTLIALTVPVFAQQPAAPKPQDTEVWEPVPKIVTPGASNAAPPSDAIVLFDGKNLDEWVSAQDKSPAKWIVADGVLIVSKAPGVGNIETRRAFRNYQLHIEGKIRENITGTDNDDGSLKTRAYVTVFFNGVLVQNHFELKGQTLYIGHPFYKKYETAPIKLQAHGDHSEPISFRNIWVRELN
jgi:hypothetical protein